MRRWVRGALAWRSECAPEWPGISLVSQDDELKLERRATAKTE
jgi:hypothetical protein